MRCLASCTGDSAIPTSRRVESLPRRSGFTIVEVLVVIAVIGILLAITIPAVSMARSSARTLQCKNNLHNLGIAIHNFQATTGHFPRRGFLFDKQSYSFSFVVELLPYLEKRAVYEKFDFHALANSGANLEVSQNAGMTVLYCPDQGIREPQTSYLANGGTGLTTAMHVKDDGFVADGDGTRPGDFPNGLSNIVAVAECTSLDAAAPSNRGAIRLVGAQPTSLADWTSIIHRCRGLDPTALSDNVGFRTSVGAFWSMGYDTDSYYLHFLRPTENSCECDGPGDLSLATANSSHAAGVNCLLGDGSIFTASSTIDAGVWNELGSR